MINVMEKVAQVSITIKSCKMQTIIETSDDQIAESNRTSKN